MMIMRAWIGILALHFSVSYDPQHLALLVPNQFVERNARLVLVVRGLDGPERRSLRCLGHDVIDVKRPRDPIVRVREAGPDSEAGSTACAA